MGENDVFESSVTVPDPPSDPAPEPVPDPEPVPFDPAPVQIGRAHV